MGTKTRSRSKPVTGEAGVVGGREKHEMRIGVRCEHRITNICK